jgi:hypothetical protein
MNITNRRYKLLSDFERVHCFLTDIYNLETLNSYLLPQYFEYDHSHPCFNLFKTHRIGLWEDSNNIVGIVCYEFSISNCHLVTNPNYSFLLPQLLEWAERELSEIKDGKKILKVWITDNEKDKQELLKQKGYVLEKSFPVKIFNYDKPFVDRKLPSGFTVINGIGVDYKKMHDCFWKGFNHGDTPDDNVDCRIQMCNAPRADMSLMTIVVAPDGEYACALGMWFDEQNKYAYLEPLATVPQYRYLGLATVALTEAMKKTKALGAKYCFGGGGDFYTAIGFETIMNRELWKKEW